MERPDPSRSFHLVLHHRPAEACSGESVRFAGCELATLRLSPQQQATPFPLSFEVASDRLVELPRMFFEPDGSFVWVSPTGVEPSWQVDGVLNDRADHVVAIELKGACPRPQFERLLRIFGWPETRLVVQLVQAAAFVEDAEFFRFAGQSGWQ